MHSFLSGTFWTMNPFLFWTWKIQSGSWRKLCWFPFSENATTFEDLPNQTSCIHHRHYLMGCPDFHSPPHCQAHYLKVHWLVRAAQELVVLFAHHRNHTPNQTDAICERNHTYLYTVHYSNCAFDIQRSAKVSRHPK